MSYVRAVSFTDVNAERLEAAVAESIRPTDRPRRARHRPDDAAR